MIRVLPRLVLGGAWLVAFLFYVSLIASVRSCILKSITRVKSPLDMGTTARPPGYSHPRHPTARFPSVK